MLNFVICDDNLSVLSKLQKMLESLFIKHNKNAQVSFVSDKPKEILHYIKTNETNVAILDIDLKDDISGLDLANIIRKFNKDIYLIFSTAHLEYMLVAYKYKTFDFLPKPLTYERLEETILRLFDDMDAPSNKYIKLGNKNTLIKQDSINFIHKDGMKLVFHTDTKDYEVYSSFSKIENILPDNFVRCHKSYIANLDKISNVTPSSNVISFNNSKNDKCYIGPKYKNNFMEVFNNYGNFSKFLEFNDNTK